MNILVYTNIYPISGTEAGFTPVVKYFCEEWVKLGHKVFVVSSTTKFPVLFYYLPKFIKHYLESKKGFNFPNKVSRKSFMVVENGVKVLQLPISKLVPGEFPPEKKLEKNFSKIISVLSKEKFTPNLAVGHWVNPQMKYLSLTKEYFQCQTALTLHTVPNSKETNIICKYSNNLDRIGFRNNNIKNETIKKLNITLLDQYMCYSGVKDYFNIGANEYSPKIRQTNKIRICFVGNLIQRKYPEKIIEALNLVDAETTKFEVHYVGSGIMRGRIESSLKNKNINIIFHGRKKREEVYKIMEQCDVLVMISKTEAFGLVYLEAMLNRTIPIASYNEGFDGIIKSGVNGYLCEAGNAEELSEVFKKILNLSKDNYYDIQKNAFETAKAMTDDKMSREYLSNIYNITFHLK